MYQGTRRAARPRGRALLSTLVLIGLFTSAVMVWHSSRAAYTGSTNNAANSWSAGSVALSDDDSNSALFTTTGIVPGQTQTHCIAVTYGGSFQAAVALYASSSGGTLGPYLNLTVEEGQGGGFGSCAGFVPSAIDYIGTVSGFASTRTQWSNGAGFFAPTGAGQARTYRFTATLDPATPNGTQGNTASLDLRWEARSATAAPLQTAGDNSDKKLGLGDTVNRTSFVPVGSASWRQVSPGGTHSCGIQNDGTLWCWGNGSSGQLGLGTTSTKGVPTKVGSLTTWNIVSTSYYFSCATRTDGTLWCWGSGTNGRLGTGNTSMQTTPTQVGSGTTWNSVSLGDNHACATRIDGTLWCWGSNNHYELGQGDTVDRSSPAQVGTATTWNNVTGGTDFTCATRNDRTLWCWGYNYNGNLGFGDTTDRPTPAQVPGDWLYSSTGTSATCAIKIDGTLWCWGYNYGGNLGQGDETQRTSPTQVGAATDWSVLNNSGAHVCALKTDRTLWCWGYNGSGQLGLGSTTDHYTVTQVPGVSAAYVGFGNRAYHTFYQPWPS